MGARAPRDTDSVQALASLILNLVPRLRILVVATPEGPPLKELLAIYVDARLAWVAHRADRASQRAGRHLQRGRRVVTLADLRAIASAVGLVVNSHFEIAGCIRRGRHWILHAQNDGRTSVALFEGGPLCTFRYDDFLGIDVAFVAFIPHAVFVVASNLSWYVGTHLQSSLCAALD